MLCTEFLHRYVLNSDTSFHVSVTRYLLTVCVVILIVYWLSRKKVNSPPGPIGFPILGYLPFLTTEPYVGLHKLSEKYGNVFGLYMGRTYVVILADYSAVQEAFSKSTTVDRPESVFDFIPDGVGFSSVNGQEWVEQRRYCVRSMRNLGLGKDNWESLVQVEVDEFVELLSSLEGAPFDPSSFLLASVSNNISSLVFGTRLSLDDKTREFLADSIDASSQFAPQFGLRSSFPALYDAISSLFGFADGHDRLRKLADFNNFVRDQVKEHKTQMIPAEDDFINGYLLKIKENEELNLGNTFNERNLFGNIQALFIGASDTTQTSLMWLFVIMAAHPTTLQSRIHEELDRVLGVTEGGMIRWAERAALPYTYATIMEGQRWRTVAPLNTARIAMEDIQVGGYDIPKGTTIIANNWGVHNDTRYWKDPEKFRPERFLSDDGKQVNFKPESYVAFSYGKRNCPGETVAMIEILFYFVAVLQKFRVLPPEGKAPKLEGTLGLTYHAVKQELRFIKRR